MGRYSRFPKVPQVFLEQPTRTFAVLVAKCMIFYFSKLYSPFLTAFYRILTHGLSSEQWSKVGILHKYRSEYEHCALPTNFLSQTFVKENCYFFLFFGLNKCDVGVSISELIALEGLSIVSVCFTKSGLILSDEDVYRQKPAWIMAKLYLLELLFFLQKKMECG